MSCQTEDDEISLGGGQDVANRVRIKILKATIKDSKTRAAKAQAETVKAEATANAKAAKAEAKIAKAEAAAKAKAEKANAKAVAKAKAARAKMYFHFGLRYNESN